MTAAVTLDRLSAALEAYGLITRGGFVSDEMEDPNLFGAKSVVMVGHFGSSIWPHFVKWRASHPAIPDPLDSWSKEILNRIAMEFGATAVFPSDKPYLPFQQWAKRAEGLSTSPLGLLIHPEFGLWQAFRGALLFDDRIEFPQLATLTHPCASCGQRPCLSACPVEAFDGVSFAVNRCRDYLATETGEICMGGGCLSRLACPVGSEYAYVPDQQRLHMEAFAGA